MTKGQHQRKKGDGVANCPQCGGSYPGYPVCCHCGFPLDGRTGTEVGKRS